VRHRVAGRKLDRPTEHRLALYRNQVAELIDHEKMVTTVAKAKEVKGLAERIITLGKEGSLASRRHAQAFVTQERVVKKVFDDLARRYATRPGGYVRLVRIGQRRGDAAEMAQLELVE
jgi:large subunit ribosomal protein L17